VRGDWLHVRAIWNKFLTERDQAVLSSPGYAARQGFGKRAALLVIDVSRAFCGDRPQLIAPERPGLPSGRFR
jgi:hypothetical protein